MQTLLAERLPLDRGAFLRIPLGSVRPTGWPCVQLPLQADGFTRHLGEVWPDVIRISAGTQKGDESNIFCLDPNLGRGTANLHQRRPRLAASLRMATTRGGLSAFAYGPPTRNAYERMDDNGDANDRRQR